MPTSARPWQALATLAWLLAVCAATVLYLRPPQRDPVEEGGFSTPRALKHLEVIAREAHPIGSPANERVREYLVQALRDLGYDVELQRGTVRSRWRDRDFEPVNIIARRGGSAGTDVLLMAAHYDSVPAGPGAADDGAAVAALLEVARVLQAQERPRNDLVILLTDGEEAGLLGAELFVSDREQLQGVGVVLNFEARGTSGPSMMFETSAGAGWLVEEFCAVAPHPLTTSLAAEVYRHMPNDTDFSVFTRAGLEGLNFAFIGSAENYHSARDDLQHLDPASLRHHGLQALALARHFLDMDFAQRPSQPDLVYFSFLWPGVARYGQKWTVLLAAVAVMLLIGGICRGLADGRLRVAGLRTGLLICVLIAVASAGIALAACRLLDVFGPLAGVDVFAAGVVLLVVAAALLGAHLAGRRLGDVNVGMSALVWTALIAVATAVWMPAASYLALWPLICAMLAWILLLRAAPDARLTAATVTALNLLAVPVVVAVLPIGYMTLLALGPGLAPAVCPIVVMMVWCLQPQLCVLARPYGSYLWPVLALAAGVCLVMSRMS